MDDQRVLIDVYDAARVCGTRLIEDEDGKIKNRTSAYACVDRLPSDLKVKVGGSLRVHLPKLLEWIDAGGNREAA